MAELPLRVFSSAPDLRALCLLVLYNTSGLYGRLMDKRHQPHLQLGRLIPF
jgi:nitrate reductase gamma subunit